MSASPAPALAQALENYADIQDSKQELSLTDRVRFLHDSAEAMRAAADALRAAVRGAETPTCATHGDPLVCLACEADEDKHPAWRQACPKCGGLPPGEASGAGDLCYCTPAAVPPAPAPLPQLGKGVNPIYFVSLAEMFRTNDNWIIFQFREGGTIRVPIHEDHNCVLAEPERH